MSRASTCDVSKTFDINRNIAQWADDKDAQAHMTAKVASNMASYASLIESHYLKGPYVRFEGNEG